MKTKTKNDQNFQLDEKITHEEIKDLILQRGLIIEDVIDAVCDLQGRIGVGYISLGDYLRDYCYQKINRN